MSDKQELTTTVKEKQIDTKAKELSDQIAKAQTKDEITSLYDEFKLNDTKKNVFRLNKLNDMLDLINKEAYNRLKNNSSQMDNKQLLDYMTAVQNQIDRSKNVVNDVKNINATQINNNTNVTVHIDGNESNISRESREKILDFIKEIAKMKKEDDNESNIIDVTEVKEGDNNGDNNGESK